jgi:hypothetical protein
LVLLAPALALFVLVSSHTEFNIHLRYVFPSLGLALVCLGQVSRVFSAASENRNRHADRALDAVSASSTRKNEKNRICRSTRRKGIASVIVALLIGYSVISALLVYPHHLAYFNDFVGGPNSGHKHLLGSSLDWGQDWLYLRNWMSRSSGNRFVVIYSSGTSPTALGLKCDAYTYGPYMAGQSVLQLSSGVYVVSRNYTSGDLSILPQNNPLAQLRNPLQDSFSTSFTVYLHQVPHPF